MRSCIQLLQLFKAKEEYELIMQYTPCPKKDVTLLLPLPNAKGQIRYAIQLPNQLASWFASWFATF